MGIHRSALFGIFGGPEKYSIYCDICKHSEPITVYLSGQGSQGIEYVAKEYGKNNGWLLTKDSKGSWANVCPTCRSSKQHIYEKWSNDRKNREDENLKQKNEKVDKYKQALDVFTKKNRETNLTPIDKAILGESNLNNVNICRWDDKKVVENTNNTLFVVTVGIKKGLIDENDNILSDLQWDSISIKILAGYFIIVKKAGMYGFINRNGKIIAEPKFKNVKVVSDRMTVMIDTNKWMHIEPNGQLHEIR